MSPVSPNRVQIKIAGPFQVIGSDKRNCTPSSKKACAILAMLALANGFTRSRQWLQDTLWSDREQTQGAASLRQSLSHLRRMLGDDRDLIRANLSMVSLDRSRFELHFELENQAFSGLVPGIDFEFLEGVDVRDPEFKIWLRDQRSFLQKSVASADLGHVATTQSNGAGHAQHLHNPVAARPRPTIVLAPSTLLLSRELFERLVCLLSTGCCRQITFGNGWFRGRRPPPRLNDRRTWPGRDIRHTGIPSPNRHKRRPVSPNFAHGIDINSRRENDLDQFDPNKQFAPRRTSSA